MVVKNPGVSAKSAEDAETEPALWRRPVPVGYGIGFTSFATIAAPLLTGFSLTTIVALSSAADNRGTRGDIAIAAFTATTALMLFTLQAGIAASQRAIPPDQRASQYPEARHRLGWMQRLRDDQWRDEKLAWQLYARCRWTYNIGIIAFISGLIALLAPYPNKRHGLYAGLAFHVAALVIASVALLIEIVLTVRRPNFVIRRLVPGSESQPARLKNVKKSPDIMSSEEAQRLAFGEYQAINGAGPDVANAAVAFMTVTSALTSLTARLTDLSQAVERSASATIRQAEMAQEQLTLSREESARRLRAAVAMRRANIEVTGPFEQEPPTLTEERWKIFNHGPAVARTLSVELPPIAAQWLKQDVYLVDRVPGHRPGEMGDLGVGMEVEVSVSKAGDEAYPVSVVLRWTDDEGPHKEHRFIGYRQS